MNHSHTLKIVELFAGTKSCSKVARRLGHKTWTNDINPDFNCDLTGDILEEEIQVQIMNEVKNADVVWMSPECTKWSLSAGNTYWTKYRMPRRDDVYDSIKMMLFCRFVADYCVKNNKFFFIENPNGKRCWYCQYGDTRAKPTNIWTNLENWNPKTCHNGNKDCHHESAPRGSKTGTQGLKGSINRSRIPPKLFVEIFETIKLNSEKQKVPCTTKHGIPPKPKDLDTLPILT